MENRYLKELDKAEKMLTEKLNNEIKTEEYINNLIESVTSKLLNDTTTTCIINSEKYILSYRISKVKCNNSLIGYRKKVFLVCSNLDKFDKYKEKYKPYTASGDYNDAYNLKSNIKVVVEGLIRSITGTIKASMIPD